MQPHTPFGLSQELFSFFPEPMKTDLYDAERLWEFWDSCPKLPELSDYSFLVFPIGRCYEGFLKEYFFRAGLIDRALYEGRNFRVGRSFNPDLPVKFRDSEWLYDNVSQMCGEDVAKDLWQAWLDGRNHLFHYFPNDRYAVSISEARDIVMRIVLVMERAILCLRRA